VNAALAALPDPRPASPGLSGMTAIWRWTHRRACPRQCDDQAAEIPAL